MLRSRSWSVYPVHAQGSMQPDQQGSNKFLHIAAMFEPGVGFDPVRFKTFDEPLLPHRSPAGDMVRIHASRSGVPSADKVRIIGNVGLQDHDFNALRELTDRMSFTWDFESDLCGGGTATVEQGLRTVNYDVDGEFGPVVFPEIPNISVVLAGLRALAVQRLYLLN